MDGVQRQAASCGQAPTEDEAKEQSGKRGQKERGKRRQRRERQADAGRRANRRWVQREQ
jgi:hypothetical protein